MDIYDRMLRRDCWNYIGTLVAGADCAGSGSRYGMCSSGALETPSCTLDGRTMWRNMPRISAWNGRYGAASYLPISDRTASGTAWCCGGRCGRDTKRSDEDEARKCFDW